MAASEDELTTIAAQLYRMPPGEFTTQRTARARAAKDDGNRELAQAITKLKKPSVAAWVIDAVARERPGDLDELADVADDLGSLQRGERVPGGPAALDERRRSTIARVLGHAFELAKAQEVSVSSAAMDEVEATLRAVLADASAAAAARTGLLVRSLHSTGWDPVDLSGALAVENAHDASAPGKRTSATKRTRASKRSASAEHEAEERGRRERRDAAERELHRARERQREAEAELRAAASALREAAHASDEAAATVERLRAELDEARDRAEQAGDDQRSAEHEHERAAKRAAEAEQAVGEAEAALRNAS
jgi:hypothetical protein